MGNLFHVIFYEPLYNLLVFIYGVMPIKDFGLAVIIITIIVKLILYPFSQQSIKAQRSMMEIQPKLEEIKEKHKEDKQAQAQATIKLYQENKVNPFSSCLPMLVQLPFLFALYRVFIDGLNNNGVTNLYPFIKNPGTINSVSFGFLDLAIPSLILAILAGLAQFFQTKLLQVKKPETKNQGAADESIMSTVNKQMLFMMPIITVLVGSQLPGGLVLYWLITTLLTILQQKITLKTASSAKNQ